MTKKYNCTLQVSFVFEELLFSSITFCYCTLKYTQNSWNLITSFLDKVVIFVIFNLKIMSELHRITKKCCVNRTWDFLNLNTKIIIDHKNRMLHGFSRCRPATLTIPNTTSLTELPAQVEVSPCVEFLSDHTQACQKATSRRKLTPLWLRTDFTASHSHRAGVQASPTDK